MRYKPNWRSVVHAVLLSLAGLGCGPVVDRAPHVEYGERDPELYGMLVEFEGAMRARGAVPKWTAAHVASIRYADIPNDGVTPEGTIGRCDVSDWGRMAQLDIRLVPAMRKESTLYRRSVVAHEGAHCLYYADHSGVDGEDILAPAALHPTTERELQEGLDRLALLLKGQYPRMLLE